MNQLSALEIVGIWERGRGQTLGERAVELLAAGGHERSPELVSVGERDASLTELRALTFGADLEALVVCPRCEETLEVELSAADLAAGEPAMAEQPLELELDGKRVRFRLPSAADLAALDGADVDAGERELLGRCLLEPAEPLGPGKTEAVAARMAAEDPGARVELEVSCPQCEREWSAPFDIVSFLWAEIDACARRLLDQVHVLASAYGWREAEILALSSARREAYLERVAG